MDYNFWNYFCILENDLINLEQYIEFTKCNFPVFSSQILKIYLAASSEFEVVMKEIGRQYEFAEISNPKDDRNINIVNIKHLIDNSSNLFIMKDMEISFKYFDFSFFPIKELWNKNNSWWNDYNYVKHNRSVNFQKSNLENLLKSMGALFLANVFFYEKMFHNNRLSLDDNISITMANIKQTKLVELILELA